MAGGNGTSRTTWYIIAAAAAIGIAIAVGTAIVVLF